MLRLSAAWLALPGRCWLAEFHKPAAEPGVPRGPLHARIGKLGTHIGKLGSERGDYQLVMIDDRLAICGRFERRIGLDGMCSGHLAGHHAGAALPQLGAVTLRVFGKSPRGRDAARL